MKNIDESARSRRAARIPRSVNTVAKKRALSFSHGGSVSLSGGCSRSAAHSVVHSPNDVKRDKNARTRGSLEFSISPGRRTGSRNF